jgi:hypothetical protein
MSRIKNSSMALSLEQQIEKLRRAARFSWIPKGLFGLTLALIALALLTKYEFLFVIGVFAGLFAVAAGETAPHRRNAIKATRNGKRSKGNVSIAITRDPTEFDRHVATVRDEAKNVTWQFQFTPNDWEPTDGELDTEIYYVLGVDWPALLITPKGILFPAFTPRKVTENA